MDLPVKYRQRMKNILSPEDFELYCESLENESKKAVSLNLNYVNPEFHPGFDIQKIPYFNHAYFHDQQKIGNTLHYQTGAFYPQEAFAMLPVLSFDIERNWRCLDLCAAPGGKTILLANQVTEGFVISNEIDYKRSKILYSNIERMGLRNVIITQNTAEELSKTFNDFFDCILIDAPCSGEGMFKKEAFAMDQWSENLVKKCQEVDFDLVDKAHGMLKENGMLIYSTCTFSREENEEVIQYLIDQYGYETIPSKSFTEQISREGLGIKDSRRCYPFLMDGHGQFFCALRKKTSAINHENPYKYLPFKKNQIVEEFIRENLVTEISYFKLNNQIYSFKDPYDLGKLRIVSFGVLLGQVQKNYFVPNHYFFKAFSHLFKNQIHLERDNPILLQYIKGEELELDIPNGFGVIYVDQVPLGGFKASNQKLKNHYPKSFRRVL